MIKYDLKSGYHYVEIHKAFQQYLGFSWSVNGEIKYYVFTVLPFGLSSASFLFTKLMREIVKYWRSLSYPQTLFSSFTTKPANFKSCLIELDISETFSGLKQHQPSSKYTIMG
jgi:hypothetical protein